MSTTISVTGLRVEGVWFPPAVKPPGSVNSFFLGGAGEEIDGNFVNLTAIGIYLEENAVPSLAAKWKGKSAEELTESVPFFRDVVTGDFEKCIQVTMITPLTGAQYAERVAEICVPLWVSIGIYTEEEVKAIRKFIEVFKDETFPPETSILFTQSPHGTLTISFPKYGKIPEAGNAIIENKLLSEAILESIIGKHRVLSTAKKTLAERLSSLLDGNIIYKD